MQQNAYLKQSLNFASKVQKQVKEKAGRVDKGVQQAGFLVLWRTAMPSVLIETEFLSNTESEKFGVSEKGQNSMARAIFSAFRQYKDEVEGKYARYDDDVENGTPYVPVKDTMKKVDSRQSTIDNHTADPAKDSTKKADSKHPDSYRETIDNKTAQPNKDSIPITKEPIIDNDTTGTIAAKDSSLARNEMMSPVKDTVKSVVKKDSIRIVKKDTLHSPPLGLGKIIYKVQFMSSGQRIPLLSEKFKGLKDIGEYPDNGSFKYTAGEFKTIDEAMKYRAEMQKAGYKDCFVVKFKDEKRMKND